MAGVSQASHLYLSGYMRGGAVSVPQMDAAVGRAYTAFVGLIQHFGAVSVFAQPDTDEAVDVYVNGAIIPVVQTWDSGADGSGVNTTSRPAFRVSLHYINIGVAGPVVVTASANTGNEEGWLVWPFQAYTGTGNPAGFPFKDIQFRSGYGSRFEGGGEGIEILTDNSSEIDFFYGTTPARLFYAGTNLQEMPDPNVNTLGTKYIMPEYPLETIDPVSNKFYAENKIQSEVAFPGGLSIVKASIWRPDGGGGEKYIYTPANGNRLHMKATDQGGWQDLLLPYPQVTYHNIFSGTDVATAVGLTFEDEPIVQAQACRSWDVYNTPMDYGTTFDPGPQYPNDADVGLRWVTHEAVQVYGVLFHSPIDRPASEIAAGVSDNTGTTFEVCSFIPQDVVAGWNTWLVAGGPFTLDFDRQYVFWIRVPAGEYTPQVETFSGGTGTGLPNVQEGTGLALDAIVERQSGLGGTEFAVTTAFYGLSAAVYPIVCTDGAVNTREIPAWTDDPLVDPEWDAQFISRRHGVYVPFDPLTPWYGSNVNEEHTLDEMIDGPNSFFWENSPKTLLNTTRISPWWPLKFTVMTFQPPAVASWQPQPQGYLDVEQAAIWNYPASVLNPEFPLDTPVKLLASQSGKSGGGDDLAWDGSLNIVPPWNPQVVEGVGAEEASASTFIFPSAFIEAIPTPSIPFPAGTWGSYDLTWDGSQYVQYDDTTPREVTWWMLALSLNGIAVSTSRTLVSMIG